MSDYDKVIELDSHNALTYYNRAIIKSVQKDWKGALEDYTNVLYYNPENLYTLYNRGLVKIELKDYKGAISDFNNAIASFPDFAYAYMARSSAKEYLNDRWGSYADQDTAMAIMQRMSNTDDSIYLAFSDKAQLQRVIELEADFNRTARDKGQIQYQSIHIELEPLWMISCFASDDEYIKAHRSDAWDKILDNYNENNSTTDY